MKRVRPLLSIATLSAEQHSNEDIVMKVIRIASVVSLLIGSSLIARAQYRYPFQNPNLPVNQRIKNVLSLMTLQEKIDLLGKSMNVPRLGIYGCGRIDSIPGSTGQFEGLHGLAVGGPNHWERRSPGMPSMGGTSTIPTTQFPQATGLGETWDPALIEQVAGEEGREARYIYQTYNRGGLIVRAPNADLARDPRWGRLEESYGEDPYFVGTMSAAFVRGLQGNNPRYWLTASLIKHFMANSNEDGRIGSSSNFDARLLHEYYSAPFRMAIEQGGADSMMAAYNAVNGIPMTANPLLRNLVIKQWGLNGIIDTDRGALTFMVTKHKYYPDMAESATGAIHAGINQFLNNYQDAVKEALQRKLITEKDIDRNLTGVIRVMIRLGFLDPSSANPYAKIKSNGGTPPWDENASKELVLRTTEESIVLLKNSSHLLPLDLSRVHSIAVVGPMANAVYSDGYGGTPPFTITPLQGLRDIVGSRAAIHYSADDQQATELAKASDVAIVFVGNEPFCHKTANHVCPNPTGGQEGIDRKEIHLEPDQENLIQRVYAANPHTIVVLVSSFPFTIGWTKEHVPAILNVAHSSEEEGAALANVIFGNYNPAGRLTITWPASIDQLPPMMDYDIRDGRTYMYAKGTPLFPFGFGLSYSTFRYSDLNTSASTLSHGKSLELQVEITNTSARSGDEVVQLYVRHIGSKVPRPQLELEGFSRVYIPAHQSRFVKIPLAANNLRYWDTAKRTWVLEKDKVEVMVGSASNDIKVTKTITVR